MALGKGRDWLNFISVRKFAWMGGRIYNAWACGQKGFGSETDYSRFWLSMTGTWKIVARWLFVGAIVFGCISPGTDTSRAQEDGFQVAGDPVLTERKLALPESLVEVASPTQAEFKELSQSQRSMCLKVAWPRGAPASAIGPPMGGSPARNTATPRFRTTGTRIAGWTDRRMSARQAAPSYG